MDSIELRCKDCTAFLRVKPKSTIITEVVCSNSKCKATNQIKIVNSQSSEADLKFKFEGVSA